MYLVASIHSNYLGVARALGEAHTVRPMFVSARLIASSDEINVDVSFRIDSGNAHVPLFFDALAYTLVVLNPEGNVIAGAYNTARGVYVGRYSYWGKEQPLKAVAHSIFKSPSIMRSLYKDRLLKELSAGHHTLVALGELTLEVETKFGRQTVAIPFDWRFSLESSGG